MESQKICITTDDLQTIYEYILDNNAFLTEEVKWGVQIALRAVNALGVE